jgi:hypothetical protein
MPPVKGEDDGESRRYTAADRFRRKRNVPPTPQPAKKDTEKSIPVPPFGKITYLASYEGKVLPQLTGAVKVYKTATDLDGQLREKFQVMDKFSKSIPPLEKVKEEFLKVDAAVKVEAQGLQDIEIVVKTIQSLLSQIGKAAVAAQKNLVITGDELKAADDERRANELKAQLNAGPFDSLNKVFKTATAAAKAWTAVEFDSFAAIGTALDLTKSVVELLGLDKLNQQIHSLEEEASKLKWKSVVAKFKLAQQQVKDLQDAHASLVGPFKKAQDQYLSRKKNVPLDFDAYNKKGKFQFKSMNDLSDMLKTYRQFAQQVVTDAYHATESIYKMQGALGTQWMSNASQDKDILEKMRIVTKRVMDRAIHERDGADAHVKIVQKQIDELEVILSKTRLKAS